VGYDVLLRGFAGMLCCVLVMSVGEMRMVGCFFVLTSLMMLGSFAVVTGCMGMVLGCVLVMLGRFLRHVVLLWVICVFALATQCQMLSANHSFGFKG
jgi:hypothetical protein